MAKQMKFIFVTGGVVSSLGKGISAACIGRLLKRRGLNIFSMKLDPYLNIDPGTMSPYQHGEVFVTKDGAETDLDLGHYERIINTSLTKESSVTSGKVYSTVCVLPVSMLSIYKIFNTDSPLTKILFGISL